MGHLWQWQNQQINAPPPQEHPGGRYYRYLPQLKRLPSDNHSKLAVEEFQPIQAKLQAHKNEIWVLSSGEGWTQRDPHILVKLFFNGIRIFFCLMLSENKNGVTSTGVWWPPIVFYYYYIETTLALLLTLPSIYSDPTSGFSANLTKSNSRWY